MPATHPTLSDPQWYGEQVIIFLFSTPFITGKYWTNWQNVIKKRGIFIILNTGAWSLFI